MNAAEGELDKARDLPNLVQWVVNMEQRKLRRSLLSRVRRHSQNVIARRHDNEVGSKVRGKVIRIRHRVTMNVYGSARRRLWARLNISNVEPVRHLEFGNRSRRLLVAEPRVRRAAKEKKRRALMVSRLRRNSNSASSRSNGSRVARLPQPIAARHKDSRKAGGRGNQKKRHSHGHNNFGAVTPAAPE